MNNTIRVMIVDDHPAMRVGLAALLGSAAVMTIVAIAANGAEAVQLFHLHHPDVTLMDLRMPVMDGIVATKKLLREDPEARIVILSGYDGDEYIYRGLRAGAKSYLPISAITAAGVGFSKGPMMFMTSPPRSISTRRQPASRSLANAC
jgi:DNA-binding NarL/FixJ family response regulator